MRANRFPFHAGIVLALALAWTGAAQAEQHESETDQTMQGTGHMLPGIFVTATKRPQAEEDVPFSLNVQSEEDIERLNTTDLEDLSRNVAGLSIQNLGPGQSVISIRGVSSGQIVRDQPGVKEQVGIYLDETPISLSLFTPDIDLFDLNRVETLRGPQGTLFGSGSIGGTVRYITNQPLMDVNETKIEIDANQIDDGSNGEHFKLASNLSLGDSAAARAVAYYTGYGGFIDALQKDGSFDDDVNDGTRHGGRLAVLWKPAENLTITPRIVYQDVDIEGFNREEIYNLFRSPYTDPQKVAPVELGRREQFLLLDEGFEDETLIIDTIVKWDVNDSFDITYTTAHVSRDILASRDASALTGSVNVDPNIPINLSDEDALRPSNLRDTTDLEQVTHELRFSSSSESDLQWLAGVFYSDVERDYSQRLPTPGYDQFVPSADANFPNAVDSPYSSDLTYDLQQTALFGEMTYTLLERFELTAGLRWYDWEEDKTFTSGGPFSNSTAQHQDIRVSSDGYSPRFMVSYEATGNLRLNAQVSKGFRLGGVNDPLNQPLCGAAYDSYRGFQEFDDETLWNYEVGFKSSFDKIAVSGSVYYTDIEDLGVNIDAGPCSSRVTISVPESHTAGAELEVTARPTSELLLTFSGSYVEAEFDSSVKAPDGSILHGIEDGNRIPSVPEWQFSGSATYTLPGFMNALESFVTASWQYVDDSITQPGDQVSGAGTFKTNFPYAGTPADQVTNVDIELDSYHLINLSAGLVYENMDFTLFAKNITDENPKLAFDRERGGRARLGYRVGTPRTFGITARMYF
ncbi:MAG: TonB-dependent receptor [Gammaproteobacteria bacterium]|nr:TonB-dependent receptor [Gammaproteobacteria bacterium]